MAEVAAPALSSITVPTVDTSSYKNALPTGQPTVLETAHQLGAMEQQKTAIDQQKFNLAKDKWGAISRELGLFLGDKNVTREKVLNKIGVMSKVYGIPREQFAEFEKDIPNDAQGIHRTIEDAMLRGASVIEQMEYHLGKVGTQNVGGQDVVTRTSPKFGTVPTGQQFPHTLPSTTQEYKGESGRPQFRGPQPYPFNGQGMPVAPPGPVQQGAPLGPPPGATEARPIPVPATPIPPGGLPTSAGAPQAAQTGLPVAQPPATGAPIGGPPRGQETSYAAPPVLFEEGRKAYTEDSALATQRLTAVKPAYEAFKLMDKLGTPGSGPGTAAFNEVVAGLKAFGILPINANDPTAVYQEINKYLAQYVRDNPSSSRSDAAQAITELSSPNVNTQILPALKNLTRNAIGLDLVQAARARTFEGDNYGKYLEHRSSFPAQMDQKAFTLNLMEPKERKALLEDMYKKKNSPEGQKFWNSLDVADKILTRELNR